MSKAPCVRPSHRSVQDGRPAVMARRGAAAFPAVSCLSCTQSFPPPSCSHVCAHRELKNKCLYKPPKSIHFETRNKMFSQGADEGSAHLAHLLAEWQKDSLFFVFFLYPHLLSRARLLISVWAELESTCLNVFIFLGEVQGRGSRGRERGRNRCENQGLLQLI